VALTDTTIVNSPPEVVPAPTAGPDRPGLFVALAVAIAGLLALLIATFVVRSMATVPRSALALAGGVGIWVGLQRLGVRRYGRGFSLGLILAAVYLAIVGVATLFANFLPIDGYSKTVLEDRRIRPGLRLDEPFGRDLRGGSMLSRVIYAGRVSLTIAFLAVLVGLMLGSLLGLLSGYFGGWVEGTINIFTNSSLAFPPLILLIVIATVFNRTVWSISLGLAVVSVPTYARIMRAQTLSLRQREFVLAARSMGASRWRVIFKEILPNAILPVASYSFVNAAVLIIAEGSLAYLGLSVKFPQPTWGAMVADAQDRLRTDPHLVFVPAIVMFLTVLALNRLGDYARKRVVGERNTI
jgi:peptide/nickel transport system permease protein